MSRRKVERVPPADAKVLRYAGSLGHPYVIVIDDGEGGRRVAMELSDSERGLRLCRAEYVSRAPVLYEQGPRAVWAKVAPCCGLAVDPRP